MSDLLWPGRPPEPTPGGATRGRGVAHHASSGNPSGRNRYGWCKTSSIRHTGAPPATRNALVRLPSGAGPSRCHCQGEIDMAAAPSSRPPVVLIHGLWVNGRSWEEWVEHYTAAGYEVHAPSWPGLEGEPADLRRNPTYGGVGIGEVADSYAELASRLSRPPIAI